MDRSFESPWKPWIVSAPGYKLRVLLFDVSQNFPKKFFRKSGTPGRVRVSQAIPARRNTIPNLSRSLVKTQTVANIIQTQRMTQLSKDHGHNMACRRESARLNFVLALKFFDKFFRNVLDNLPQHCQIML